MNRDQVAVRPVVTAPITGGRGEPFAASMLDVAAYGYTEVEYLLEGTATRYRPEAGTDLDREGHWSAEPAEEAPFRTRMLVYRPSDPARFNGTVVLTWNNVTSGYDLFGAESLEIFEGGFALACLTTQKVGVAGLPPEPQGLAAWDPARYGALSIPSDDYSYDIFTQGARAVGTGHARQPVDPMDGLAVERVVAVGASQSAARLATYLNAIQPRTRALDGFILLIHFGAGSVLEAEDAVLDINLLGPMTPDRRPRGMHQLRDDLGVPVFVVNSELEAIACHGVLQADTDTFRYWEVAGTSHGSAQALRLRQNKLVRDKIRFLPVREGINAVPMTPLFDAAYHHMQRWLTEGMPPPVQPRVEFSGEPAQVARDEHGIAKGGIRLPQVEVPLATNSAIPLADDIIAYLRGSSRPFDTDKVRALYGDRATFLTKFEAATRCALEAGVLLQRDVPALIAEASDSWPG